MTDEKQKRRAIFINDSKTTSSQRPIEKVTVQKDRDYLINCYRPNLNSKIRTAKYTSSSITRNSYL
jgi:hypothetical protein